MAQREAALVRAMIRYARDQGCFAKKNHGGLYGVAGEPDLLVLIPVVYQRFPVPVFCEVKVPGKVPKPAQLRALSELCSFGALAVWVDTLAAFKAVIQGVKGGTIGNK